MKISIRSFLILAFSILIVIYCGTSSLSSDDEDWEFLGRQTVGIDSVAAVLLNSNYVFTDTIRSADTLSLRIYTHTINGDKYERDSLSIVVKPSGVDLLLKADIYDYTGSSAMPPTDLNPTGLPGNTLELPPPFEIGNFISILHQPDGEVKLDTIIVIQ